MVAWINNAHKHPKAFTLTEIELKDWKKWRDSQNSDTPDIDTIEECNHENLIT